MKRIAVIDLGTNTFHLLIAEAGRSGPVDVVRRVDPVKLGEGGITAGVILPDPFSRGLKMMETYSQLIRSEGAEHIRAIATSAIRSAGNGVDFLNQVERLTGIRIEIIDGQQEAQFIYQGVKASGSLASVPSLIMDIGGGSVEFILCTSDKILWKQSFEIGAARLMALFHQNDPIAEDEVNRLNQYLEEKLSPLFTAAQEFPVKHLIGSAGAFETFMELAETGKETIHDYSCVITYNFKPEDLNTVLSWLRYSSHEERAARKEITPVRVDMVVTAALITSCIIGKLNIQRISMSAYSLKEGVLAEMLQS